MVRPPAIRRGLRPAVLILVGRRVLRRIREWVRVHEEEESCFEKMNMNKNLLSQFEALDKLPEGILIDRPDELIPTTIRLTSETRKVSGIYGLSLSFSRLSLKHVAEKRGEGRRLLSVLPVMLSRPIEIRTAKEINRFQVISSSKDYKSGRLHSVVIERMKNGDGRIVTIFQTDVGYLEHYELLWRTAGIT